MEKHTFPIVKVIIPAFNEGESIAKVIAEIPNFVNEIIVVDNSSTDDTALQASQAGAKVLHESEKGYGYACLRGMKYIEELSQFIDIVVFMDGDYSDYPEKISDIIAPIQYDDYDFVVGARVKNLQEPGALTPQQVFGNWLATFLMRLFFNATYTDLGPFRAIRYNKLLEMHMEDKTYGWTVEMQLKSLRQNLRYKEVPVPYRKRIGTSKISGTFTGTVLAGYKILSWIFKYSFFR